MEREIVLSTYLNKSNVNNKPSNFVTDFTRPIALDSNHEYVIGLKRIINMSFTWFNINPGYNNQKIKYSSDNGSTFKEIAFPPRVYNYTNINMFLKNETVIKKDGEDDEYPINLEFQNSTLRLLMTLKTNYQLYLPASDFNELLGFDKEILKDKDNYGTRLPNVS